MTYSPEDCCLPPDFSGTVRLFPLPNLVLFPHVVQALHLFEPRYCQLMKDTLADDHLITMCLAKPTDSGMPVDQPIVHDVVCIGKIVAHHELEDGRFNLLLMGLKRARIVKEIDVDRQYRMAQVEVLEDIAVNDDQIETGMRTKLLEIFRNLVQTEKLLEKESLKSLIINQLPVGTLIDLMSFSITIPVEQRQLILATSDVLKRFRKFIALAQQAMSLTTVCPVEIDFPPGFSSN
jgi:Lon protease-like protein